jgi:hypothetical protein
MTRPNLHRWSEVRLMQITAIAACKAAIAAMQAKLRRKRLQKKSPALAGL